MEAMAAYWPIGIRMSAWSLKCGALSELARRMAEYASLFRPTCCAHAAELRAPCSARSIHNFGGCAFIHKFRFFVKNFFSFQNFFIFLSALCLLASLCEFRWRRLTEISLRLSTFAAPVNTCNIRLRLRMSCDRKAESMTAFDLARHTFPNAARTRAGVNGISVSDLAPSGRSASLMEFIPAPGEPAVAASP